MNIINVATKGWIIGTSEQTNAWVAKANLAATLVTDRRLPSGYCESKL